jgi:hypothetical protein
MADVKISQLPAATTPLAGTEEIPLVQSTTTKKVTVSGLLTTANLGTPTAINLTNATNVPVNQATGVLPVVNGGTGVTTPNIIGGTNISVTGTWPNQTVSATGSAAGNVTGPVSSTDNAVARYDNTTGQIIQNSGVIISDANVITGGTWNGTAIAVAYGGTGTATPSIVAGTNVTVTGTWPNQTINASGGGGSGTVTDMSIVSANGLAGTVATSTTTPAVTLSTTVTGVVKGNGTALSAATAGTDYVAPGGALGTPSSGTATNLTGLPLSTGVTGLLPVANGGTGTATPAIVAGTNVTVSGSWPNQTINASSSAQVYPGAGIANSTGTAWGTSYTTTGTGTVVALATGAALTNPSANQINDTNTNQILGLSPTTSAVDYLVVKNGIGVGVPLHIYADGASANTGLHIQPKGTGLVTISDGTDFNKGIRFRSSSSAASAITLLDAVSTAGRVVTLPDATTTLVGRDTTDTLTNKTINLTSNTLVATSAQMAAAVSDETGSGSLVFATSPTLVTPILGTPQSATLTNATGLPIATGVSGLGTGVATFLTTPSSANLISVVSDETGSGVLVFNSAPALTNPTVTNYVETPYSANSSTAITLALTNGTVQIITLTGNATITMPTATSGKSFIMFLKQDATGSRTVTWSTVKWAGGTAPTITSTASRQDILSFFADGTNWYGVVVGQNYTP